MAKTVLAFDLYGTLLSTESIARELGELFGEDTAKSVATVWRRYQLEYTWRLNSMGKYSTFSDVTKNALSHAVAEHSLSLDYHGTDKLMGAYDHLSTFPDVPVALNKVASNPSLTAVVFSNGTPEMLSNSIFRSADLAPHASVFKEIISVNPVGKFKPAPEVYWGLADRVGLNKNDKDEMGSMWLVSGNPFDVIGALSVGMKAGWVDRVGGGWMDALDPDKKPTVVARDLNGVIDAIQEAVGH